MRDRLAELGALTPKINKEDVQTQNLKDVDNNEFEQHAVIFDCEEVMEDTFKEAQAIQKEISQLKVEVKKLGKQNTRFLISVRRISSIKRDSNTIARSIKTKGENLYARIQKLDALCKRLEKEHGSNSALVRMVRGQFISITGSFHEVMQEYNAAEMIQKENCKTRIQRQAEIMGKEITGDQIEEMIETGKWNVFSGDLLTDGRTARSALTEIENRHKELLELESRIRDIHDLFFQLALLVEEQGAMVDNIEANVCSTQEYVVRATTQIKKAGKYKKKNPCRQLFCCCFPCCNK